MRTQICGCISAVLAIARLIPGTVFFAHGSQKPWGWFGGHGLQATIQTFRADLGIPASFACLAIIAEFFGVWVC